jgi:hypothetical protein
MYNMYALAERLHKTYAEIGEMSLTEFNGWLAYFSLVEEQNG